ncbi:MAG: M23 family metallopeptidase [Clostridia bacterium]|nr:M23 family metallopeptidase [Clostridia bacterium]
MKKSLWVVLCAIVLIIPTVVAVSYYFITKNSPITSGSVTQITLTLPHDGVKEEPESFVFKANSGQVDLNNIGSGMFGYFMDIVKNSKEVSGLPESLLGLPHYTVTFTNYSEPIDYKFYFTENPQHCYFTDAKDDSKGKCFNISADYAKAFLLSVYGMSVFDTADMPVATTPNVEYIDPVMTTWSYLTIDNLYPTYTENNEKAFTDNLYYFPDMLALTYTHGPGEPYSQSVVVLDEGGETVYSGSIEEMAFADIPKNEKIDVQLTAKWSRSEEKMCEGEMVYRFYCMITDSPEFSVTTCDGLGGSAEAGYFLSVYGKNVICEPDKIEFTSEPEIGVEPVFYKDGKVVRALIPLPYDLEEGRYNFTFTADGQSISCPFEIEEFGYKSKYAQKEEVASNSLTQSSLDEFNANLEAIFTKRSDKRYFDSEFIYPVNNSQVKSGFGRTLVTNGGFEYVNEWVRVSAKTGRDVLAMNAGKVVYVGEQTMSGTTVVVDHGLGLMTVYANLSKTEVAIDDIVNTGDVLGTTGMSGYTDGTRMSVAFVINGTYVCPYEIWDEDGIILE